MGEGDRAERVVEGADVERDGSEPPRLDEAEARASASLRSHREPAPSTMAHAMVPLPR